VHILPVTSTLLSTANQRIMAMAEAVNKKEPRKAREVYRFQDFCF
jgi:hypothetical protein